MKKSIGILGGMGPLATADLFRKIIELTDAERDCDHIRIYIDSHAAIPDRTAAILSGGPTPLPAMEESMKKLLACGADCLLIPCNTAHYFLPPLQAKTDTPFLNITTVSAQACLHQFPGRTAAVLATTGTLSVGLYQQALSSCGVPYLVPDEAEQRTLMRVIYDGVKAGQPPEAYRADMLSVLEGLSERGADYFILACTELPLAAAALELTVPIIDPTVELAKAAIRFCGYPVKSLCPDKQ